MMRPRPTRPGDQSRPELEVIDVDAGYRASRNLPGEKTRIVVRCASFSIHAGNVVAILGANGSGKTTLLKTCVGLLPALGGDVLMCGHPVSGLGARARARRISWVPQISDSAWSFTVREVVAQGRFALLGPFAPFRPADHDAIDAALEALDALELADRPFSLLSGGEARRILIARALAQDTPLLALDEPAAHLDPGRQMELMDTLARLARGGKAVVVSIHDVNAARRYADHVLLIDSQGGSCFGTPETVLTPDRLEEAFDTEFLHGDHASYGRFVLPLARKKKGKQST